MMTTPDWSPWIATIEPILTVPEVSRIAAIDRLPWVPPAVQSRKDLAEFIDHTLLSADAVPEQVVTLCEQAVAWKTGAVCINPVYVPLARKTLGETSMDIAAVAGFPLGATSSAAKAYEAAWAAAAGASEIDMVISIGLLKSQQWRNVLDDILAVRAAVPQPVRLKVIMENALLTRDEIILGCLLAVAAGSDFVKTSTGFGPSGATVEDVRLMRQVVGRNTGVKAAGGIHTAQEALAMIEAGADRIGASQTQAILEALA